MVAPRRPRLDTVDYSERPRMIVDPDADGGAETPMDAPPEPMPVKGHANRTPARRGKRAVAFWLDPVAHKQLRTLALRLDTNLQALMEEACNDLFRRHGMHRIAQETEGAESG
jgi:hypothetical protein